MQQPASSKPKNKNEYKMMRRFFVSVVLMMLSVAAFAQADKYEQRYNMLVSKFGPAGVGVETILNNWEQADSTDSKMLLGRFNYLFTKAQSAQIVEKKTKKYLGMDPILSLKDSTGTDIYYYQEIFYDDDRIYVYVLYFDNCMWCFDGC